MTSYDCDGEHEQVENEYGNVEFAYGIGGELYVKWAAETALSLNTTVPWVMCAQGDAPDPIVSIYTMLRKQVLFLVSLAVSFLNLVQNRSKPHNALLTCFCLCTV